MAAAQRDPTGKIGKQVGWLNRNKSFADPILFTKVVGPLSSLDITSAMALLKDVEQQADQIANPTAYILEAAAACPQAQRTTTRLSIDGTQKEVVVQMDPTGKIGRQIAWQNRNVALAEPVDLHQVLEPMSMIDVTTAMAILKELESKASQIKSPTEWIRSAAANAAAETGASGNAAFMGALDPTGKISRQVAWLNKNAPLTTPLVFGDVVQPLSQLDIVSAMAVLKDFEQQAANISDASAWIYQAAEKAAGNGGALPEGGLGKLDPSGKISRQVVWLNKNCDFAAPINFADVVAPLSRVDIIAAMAILKECEEQASNLRDPTGFIVTAAQKAPAGARGGSGGSYSAMPGVPLDPSGKIRRTVTWINSNVALAEKLDVEELVGRLSEVDLTPALRILKDVEENHANINNPTNFVLAASNRLPKVMAMYGGGFGWGAGPMAGGAAVARSNRQWKEESQAPGEDEGSKAISKEVGKLNREVGFPEKLSYSDVKGHLEVLGTDAALKILQDLRQSARGVSNPTSYVIAAAKRAANGEEAPAKRPRTSMDGGMGGGMCAIGSMGSWGGAGGGMGSWVGKGACGGGFGGGYGKGCSKDYAMGGWGCKGGKGGKSCWG